MLDRRPFLATSLAAVLKPGRLQEAGTGASWLLTPFAGLRSERFEMEWVPRTHAMRYRGMAAQSWGSLDCSRSDRRLAVRETARWTDPAEVGR